MTSFAFARSGALARIALALVPLFLAACGSGAVSGPTPVNDPNRITIQPDTAILYSGLPTTFTVSGGTGTYAISSSNQAAVAVPSTLNGRTFTVVPAGVVVETPVTLTVRDSGTAPLATASLTVRPGTVANDIVITPTGTQGGNCSPAICSGGDAIVSATISQGGIPLPARGVRFEVVSGDFRFITSPPGAPEVLEASTVVVSDEAGGVHARIRILPGAANQTAIVQVTDIASGAFRRAPILIAQTTGSSPGFFAVPDAITFSGPNNQTCASSGRADVYVFGGTPPYSIGNSGTQFIVNRNVVTTSGGSFGISPTGACVESLPIPIIDAAGRTTIVTMSNVLGTVAIPPLLVSPSTVTLSDCSTRALVTVAGGTGTFTASSGSGAIYALPNTTERLIGIGRVPNTTATSPLSVGVSSGSATATITVILTGEALNTRCDGSAMNVVPSSVTFNGCGTVNVLVTGGSPNYFGFSDTAVVTVRPQTPVTGTNVSADGWFVVERARPSAALATPATLTFIDSAGIRRTIQVNAGGTCV